MVTLHRVFERLVLSEAEKRCPACPRGRPRKLDDVSALTLMFKVLRTGMQWRELDCAVDYTTVLRKLHAWARCGVFDAAYARVLRTHKRLNPPSHYCVDSTYVKNAFGRECVGRNHTDRGRLALKLSAVVDDQGVPYGVCCHAGNRPDVCLLDDSLRSVLVEMEHLPLFADKGYDSRHNRGVCHRRGLLDRIFRRRSSSTRRTHARRIVVEHTFAWLKSCRRLLHFYETTPRVFLAFVFLASGNLLTRRLGVAS